METASSEKSSDAEIYAENTLLSTLALLVEIINAILESKRVHSLIKWKKDKNIQDPLLVEISNYDSFCIDINIAALGKIFYDFQWNNDVCALLFTEHFEFT